MVFTAPVFLFVFLPVSLLLIWGAPPRIRLLIVWLVSLLFYAWGEKGYVLLMAVSIAFNFALGLALASAPSPFWRRCVLVVGLSVNVGLLIFFKYTPWIVENLAALAHAWGGTWSQPRLHIHLPIGISFFTFEAISYLVDVYRGTIAATRNPIKLGVFLTLFPHLIAGPVVRYGDIARALDHHRLDASQAARGIRRFLVGLSKKLLLANPAGHAADLIFAQQPDLLAPSAIAWGALCYTLQIYLDFSGYTDMAIGVGRLVGFELNENFHYPYAAESITDFWRRWHISLSSWFRDYVYIPLGGNRLGVARTAVHLLIVFSLCGLWHGASWNFLLWGWYHGLFLILERVVRVVLRAPDRRPWLIVPRHVYVVVVVLVGWIFFRADDVHHALALLQGLGRLGESSGHPVSDYWNRESLLAMMIGSVVAMPVAPRLRNWLERCGQWGKAIEVIGLISLAILCWIVVVSETYNPFIYFRF
jgi:alginate O-acetyltransferase complex protein AlgI